MSTAKAPVILNTVILNKTIKARLIYFLYQALQIALSPALLLYLLYRGFRNPAYLNHLGERFGKLPPSFETTSAGSVWFHAVSVGEVLSAVELIKNIHAARPDVEVFLSTATLAGRATAEQRLTGLVRGIFYAPLDYRSVVRRVLRRLRPALVIVMETEIWPNLYREAKLAGASLLVVNGRISDRALPRYVKWSWFFRQTLRWPDEILVQSPQDAERYVLIGAPAERVAQAGNLKYDFQPPSAISPEIDTFLNELRPDKVWIAASTMPPAVAGDPDEDDVVVEAFRRLKKPGFLLILAPRRPERFDLVAEKLRSAGIRYVRRSQLPGPLQLPGVLLLDSIGDLAALFARADVVFMGGTFASRGGHNILEPAYFAKPVIVGPHMENFAQIADEFIEAGAVVQIERPVALASTVRAILDAPRDIGLRAQKVANAKRGVVDRVAAVALRLLGEGVPQPKRTLPARAVLTPLSWLWGAGNELNLRRQRAGMRALSTRVVSIGGLSMGGTGKSPVVAQLAERMQQLGKVPAILTRGYKRAESVPLIVRRGSLASVFQSGDEAQMFIRRGDAHVGVGAGRYEIGHTMEKELEPDIFFLDDGFQHVRLKRDMDIVLIDALDPTGGGLFPLGRRREPLSALSRATAILLTRVAQGSTTAGIEKMIRRYNTTAPIFRSRMVAEPVEGLNRGTKVGAFCGIGSPRAFWGTLEELGLNVVYRHAFEDHHTYPVEELRNVARRAKAAGAGALVTTEKDMMKLDGLSPAGLAIPVYSVRIRVEIENERELLSLIL
ncbi:MAG: tetraacyldisaccharide 4'-kinase [Acidobacteriota bacterium]